MKKANSYQHVLFGLCQRTVQLYFVETCSTAFPPFQLANEATALAQFGPLALPYGETLATCLDRRLDEASKAAVIAAIGAVQAEQHAGLLVVPWFWVVGGLGSRIFFHSVTKDEGHDTKVDWTLFQSSMDLFVWCLGLNSKCLFLHPFKLKRNFDVLKKKESNMWWMEAT